jgi:hypothetical protein
MVVCVTKIISIEKLTRIVYGSYQAFIFLEYRSPPKNLKGFVFVAIVTLSV